MNTISDISETPLRVAMLARVVFPLHGYGGIERHVFHLVTYLAKLNVAVTLFVQPPTRTDEAAEALRRAVTLTHERYDYTSPLLPPNGIVGRQINFPWYSWRLGIRAAQAVRRGEFDVVHSQGLCSLGYGLIRKRDPLLQHVPFVANPHGMEEFRTPDWRKWIAYAPFRAMYAYGHQLAERVIATDACTKDDVPHYLGVDPARVAVIPSAIDPEECLDAVRDDVRMHLRERFKRSEREPIFLSVSRLERNKGYHIMVDALARIREQLPPNWHWILVGQGREEAALRQQVSAAGLDAHITFAGRLSDIELHSLYEEVDLVVHPTLYEGSSLVTLEGMIHRRPMIASAAGGIPDKVFNERNGYLVQPGNVDDLAAALLRALERRERWAEWGEESVRIVRSTFAWDVVARQTKALYHEMLAAR